MSLDPKIINALSRSLSSLKSDEPRAIPAKAIAALAKISNPGIRLTIDLESSEAIGAPLVVLSQTAVESEPWKQLTARQNEVVRLLARGQSNKEIARGLNISIATVKDHVHAILARLELPNRGAVIAAFRDRNSG